jgi:hypothetical protein
MLINNVFSIKNIIRPTMGCLINDEKLGIRKEAVVAESRCYVSIYMKGLSKIIKTLNQDSLRTGQNS